MMRSFLGAVLAVAFVLAIATPASAQNYYNQTPNMVSADQNRLPPVGQTQPAPMQQMHPMQPMMGCGQGCMNGNCGGMMQVGGMQQCGCVMQCRWNDGGCGMGGCGTGCNTGCNTCGSCNTGCNSCDNGCRRVRHNCCNSCNTGCNSCGNDCCDRGSGGRRFLRRGGRCC